MGNSPIPLESPQRDHCIPEAIPAFVFQISDYLFEAIVLWR
jgi:hypothetical protein